MSNKNTEPSEGLITSIWGHPAWEFGHCVTFNYPHNPTNEDKKTYKTFFINFTKVLPCCICRNDSGNFVSKGGKVELKDEHLENRAALTRWFYDLHCAVNEKLGIEFNISYDDMFKKYDSYIARCALTPQMKAEAYKNYYNIEQPFIKYETALKFEKYAKSRGMIDFAKKLDDLKNNSDAFSEKWMARNRFCEKTIKKMRLSGIISTEQEGEYEGFPTIDELHLLSHMCTTMSREKVKKILGQLRGFNKQQRNKKSKALIGGFELVDI